MGQGFLGEEKKKGYSSKTLEKKVEFTNNYFSSNLLLKSRSNMKQDLYHLKIRLYSDFR
jgi:hypothetical protein